MYICLLLIADNYDVKKCLATAIHNFKWLKISLICKI